MTTIQRHSVLWGSLLVLLLAFGGAAAPHTASAAEGNTDQDEIVIQIPIPIPGATFDCKFHEGKQCVASLGDYISGYYTFFAGIIGVIAALMVMWGGIKWTTAGGNSAKVKDARDQISAALLALLITFGSYVLLYTINPELVKLQLPNIDDIVGIQQTSFKCSENPISTIDFTNCNPTNGGTECCGKILQVNAGGGVRQDCVWDICNKQDEVCVSFDTEGNNIATYQCVTAYNYCFVRATGDKREWCPKVDSVLQKALTRTGEKKFLNTGCGFENVEAGDDQCRWSVPLSRLFSLYDFTGDLANYQEQFIDCYTEGAEGVCWERNDAGNAVAKDCGGSGQVRATCRGPNDIPRPISGADGGCLVKIGQTGSTNPADYKCWATEHIDPPTGGWGTPPNNSY